MMDTRTVLAIVLSLAVLIGFQFFMAEQQPPVTQPGQQPAKKEEPVKPAAAPPVSSTAPSVPLAGEREITVESGLYKAVFTSRGGTVKYWEIKAYKDKAGK